MKKEILKIGTKVYQVNSDFDIEEKKIIALENDGKEIKYKLDTRSCGGVKKEDFFLKKSQAETYIHKFKSNLRFKVGDLIVFTEKSFGSKYTVIGRIKSIHNKVQPYVVTDGNKRYYDIDDNDEILIVKNDYIENYADIKELYAKWDDLMKQANEVKKEIESKYDWLEKDLKQSFRKEFGWTLLKHKPKFEDRFKGYNSDYY